MAVDQGGTITRGFLFADLRGYTDFVERRGAAAAAALLTRYRPLAREAIARFGGAEIKTEGDSFCVVFDSVSSAVRCGLAITAAARPSTGLPSGPWTIGVHMPLSGPAAADGVAVRNAVRLAVDQANEAGGVADVELASKAYDTGSDDGEHPARGASAAAEMAGDPRTIAAVGPFISPVAAETIPITNRAGLLECSPSNSDAGLTKPE